VFYRSVVRRHNSVVQHMTLAGLLEAVLEGVAILTEPLGRRSNQASACKPSKEVMRKRLVWMLCSLLMWLILLAGMGATVWVIYALSLQK
jgi:hypothetical protein